MTAMPPAGPMPSSIPAAGTGPGPTAAPAPRGIGKVVASALRRVPLVGPLFGEVTEGPDIDTTTWFEGDTEFALITIGDKTILSTRGGAKEDILTVGDDGALYDVDGEKVGELKEREDGGWDVVQTGPVAMAGAEQDGVRVEGSSVPASRTRKLDPEGEECRALAEKIENIREDIAKREQEIANNPGQLPERLPGGRLRDSVHGHRVIVNQLWSKLRELEALYGEKCGM